MTKEIRIYSTSHCPYCDRAKNLLDRKNIEYQVIDLTSNPDELSQLKERTGMKTVPQIFFDNELIGGFQELSALEESGKLDEALQS